MAEQTLLCVDDERPILNALKRLLRKEGYRLLTAEDGPEALDVLDREPVQVVISDYRMPGMSGTALLREVKSRHPETVRVVLSGYADAHVVVESINIGEIYRFLPKP
jgi:DNA-binding NtrC family response regulator